jgi:serine/threonine protein kinase
MTRNADPASLTIAKRIDAHCDRFEAEWRAGRQPRLEAFLGDAKSPERSQLFRALLAVELELLLKAGRPLDPGPYQKRFPDQAAAIEAVIREVGGAAGSVEDLASRDTSVSRSDAARRSEQATGSYQGSAAPGASPATPQKIGRFEILAVLGEGAFGKVYRARDPHLDREVAIKVPLAGTLEKDRELERFLLEARAAATIRHANICPVYEVGQDGSIHYIVMAFVPGQSLAANLASRKEPLPQRQAALIVRKLALALEAAHAQGIIHRDLKPTNIMFDRDRKDLVVMDFGLARRVRKDEAQLTQSGMIMGTPSYMAPEQACGDVAAIGPWSDVYSLGVIFYEMLTGRRPFTGSVAEVLGKLLHVEPEPPSKLRPDVDPRLEAICLKAMAKDPKQRYQSMKELAAALNDSTKVAIPEAKPSAGRGRRSGCGWRPAPASWPRWCCWACSSSSTPARPRSSFTFRCPRGSASRMRRCPFSSTARRSLPRSWRSPSR